MHLNSLFMWEQMSMFFKKVNILWLFTVTLFFLSSFCYKNTGIIFKIKQNHFSGVVMVIWWLPRMIRADFSYDCFKNTLFFYFLSACHEDECIHYIFWGLKSPCHKEGTLRYSVTCLQHLYSQIIESQKGEKCILMQVFAVLLKHLISKGSKKPKQIQMTGSDTAELPTELKLQYITAVKKKKPQDCNRTRDCKVM